MRRRTLVGAAAATCTLAAFATAPAAQALYFGQGATVVSASVARQELADDRSLTADVSRDGRYVAFDTRATNFFPADDPDPPFTGAGGATVATDRLGGVFRRDVDSGVLDLVADGDLVREDDGTVLVTGARNPSISADGRYVVFSTAQSLVPEDAESPRHVDVYVRDMTVPICRPLPTCGPNPYTLVSAGDGGDTPLTYADPATPQPAGAGGADVWPLTSISDDGRRVLFRTAEASDAFGATQGTPDVSAGQLLLRDLDARRTWLMSSRLTDGTPAGGASGAATLSGDGTTAAWVARNANEQTRFQPGEPNDFRISYYLWRRVGGPTRRPTGMVDVDDPGCAPGTPISFTDQVSTDPCYGPLTSYEEERGAITTTPPVLSTDGREVLFITASAPRPGPAQSFGTDVWVTRMDDGLSRKATTHELTRDGIGDPAAGAGIEAIAASPDGRYVAIATKRLRFLLPGIALLGEVRDQPDVRDLYLLDREAGTIRRVLTGLGGADAADDVGLALSIADGARRIAFVSGAANLFRGDANDRPDAFVVRDQPEPAEAQPAPEPPPVEQPQAVGEVIPEAPVLSVRVAKGKRTGEMVLEARPPAAGALDVAVSARLPGKDGKRSATTPITNLTRARARARKPERVRITVKLTKPAHLSLLRRLKTVTSTATVTWTPQDAARKPLTRRATVRFVVVKAATKAKKTKKRAAKKPAKQQRRVNDR